MSTETQDDIRFEPAPKLKAAYDAIEEAFLADDDGFISLDYDENGSIIVSSQDQNNKTAAQKMLFDVQLAYTHGDLDGNIIEKKHSGGQTHTVFKSQRLADIITAHLPKKIKDKVEETQKERQTSVPLPKNLKKNKLGPIKQSINLLNKKLSTEGTKAKLNEENTEIIITGPTKHLNEATRQTLNYAVNEIVQGNNNVKADVEKKLVDFSGNPALASDRARSRLMKAHTSQKRVIGHQTLTVPEIGTVLMTPLANRLAGTSSKEIINDILQQEFDAHLEEDTTENGKKAVKIFFPIYENADNIALDKQFDLITSTVKKLAGMNAKTNTSNTTIRNAIRKAKQDQSEQAAEKSESLKPKLPEMLSFPVKTINTIPVKELAAHLQDKNRISVLSAFSKLKQDGRIPFTVKITENQPGHPYFDVQFDTKAGNINISDLHVAELLLSHIAVTWHDNTSLRMETVKNLLEEKLLEIEKGSVQHTGDRIQTVMARMDNAGKNASPTTKKANDEENTVASKEFIFNCHSVRGIPVSDFAQGLLDKNLTQTLKVFEENPDIPFSISISNAADRKQEKSGKPYFKIALKPENGIINQGQIYAAQILIQQLRAEWKKNEHINKEIANKVLEPAIIDLKKSCEKEIGDNLISLYSDTAEKDNIQLNGNQPDALLSSDLPEVSIKKEGERRIVSSFLEFTVPAIKSNANCEQPHIVMTDEFGRERIMIPTKNQLDYDKDIKDPSIETILCSAPARSGKTYFAIRAALEMLSLGIIDRIYYERPMTTVGNHNIGALPGGIDDKVGPYGAVMEGDFMEILGHGNPKKGAVIFDRLCEEGRIERFDQIFKRGFTLKDRTITIFDESQNKNKAEFANILTRPNPGAKLIIIGDHRYQMDVRASQSGFAECIELYQNQELMRKAQEILRKEAGVTVDQDIVNAVKVIQLGLEDVVQYNPRVALTVALMKAKNDFDLAARNNIYQQTTPSTDKSTTNQSFSSAAHPAPANDHAGNGKGNGKDHGTVEGQFVVQGASDQIGGKHPTVS